MADDASQPPAGVGWARGLHAPDASTVDPAAYFEYIGRWSSLFVPALLRLGAVSLGDLVLDVASGPGEAAEPAADMVGMPGRVVGLDISTAMLRAARARLPGASCTWVAADAQRMPFADGRFDAVVCQLGLMFLPDPGAGLSEFRRVLRPGRRAAVCVIGTAERAPLWSYLAAALSHVLPAERETLHLSFALGDPHRLEDLFTSAGFSDVGVRPQQAHADLGTFEHYWHVVETASGSMPHAYRTLAAAERDHVRDEVRRKMAAHEVDGLLRVPVEMLLADGRA
ncbi:methyltransferase domain-containing protein [Nocardioides cynanchi]|uniref:methyltransferase domain-containing protein n=1 Tax=Nocardioides cynanchi TaxID=2558918 RepID=UPI0017858972|nr:methyltransferase domain-containing protein [Nocardioides cynanchi]